MSDAPEVKEQTKLAAPAEKKGAKTSRVNKLPRSRKRLFIMLGAVAGVLLVILGIRWWLDARAHESTDDAYVVAHVSNVSARVTGTVSSVLVDENQMVKAGQVLATLDPRDYQVKAEQAAAAYRLAMQQAKAAAVQVPQAAFQAQAAAQQAAGNVSGAASGIAENQAKLAEARAGVLTATAAVRQAEANLTRAQQDYARYRMLVREGAISEQQFEQATATLRVQQAQRDSAREELVAAKTRVSSAQSALNAARGTYVATRGQQSTAQAGKVGVQVAQAQAETASVNVQQAKAALDAANLNLQYCTIVAPVAGRTGKRQVEVGQQVQPGQPIFAIVQSAPWIEANFKETQLGRMKVGQRVDIEIDALKGRHFLGFIESISPASGAQFALLPPENATGNFTKIVQRVPVRISFDPKSIRGYEDRIRAGLSTVVTVTLE
jgi:membrane fusion protein (multidrug efflux system)